MATLQELYAKYFPGQDPRGEYDAYNNNYLGGLTAQQAAMQAAKAGNVDDFVVAQQWANPTYTGADAYNNIQGTASAGNFNPLGFYGGMSAQGRQNEPVVRDALQAIAQSAGIPDYDWTPAINKMAMQHALDAGGQSPTSETRLPELIRRIAVSADPQIQQTYQQIAPQINPVLEEQYTQIWNNSKDYKSDKFKGQVLKAAAVAALPIAGYYATGAGAGTAGAAEGAAAGGTAAGGTGSIDIAANLAAAEAGAGAASTNFINANALMQAGAGAAAAGGSGSGTGGAATTLPGEAGYLGGDGAMTATTGATNTLPGQVSGAGGTAAGGSALSRILEGNGTMQDYAALIGTGMDIYGANQQANATNEIANRYFNMGAPYRDELLKISADPNEFYNSPTAQNATESVLRRLSATHGNVAGSPYGQALTIDALYDQYGRERDRLAGFGGLTAYNSAAPGAAANAVGADANLWNSIGGGIADIATPRNNRQLTLQDILRGVQV